MQKIPLELITKALYPLMYELRLHPDAEADLLAVEAEDEDLCSEIIEFLIMLAGRQDLLAELCNDSYSNRKFNITSVKILRNRGINGWRLKAWDFRDHRFIYVFDARILVYYLVAVVKRSRAYSEHIANRVEEAYEELGIRKIPS